MQYYLVATTIHANAQQSAFTYHSEEILQDGQLVLISVGKKEATGVVLATVDQPSFSTKEIIKKIESTPLPMPLLSLAHWMSAYYYTHPANTWQTILPRGLQKKRRITEKSVSHPKRNRTTIVLNDEQMNAIDKISALTSGTTLLEGITGSGKTQVYIELAKRTLAKQRSVIILVPEIALTSQIIAEFSHTFDDIIVTHSVMSESERHIVWQECLTSGTPRIVIGPRSALFSPLKDVGLIVIDECHEPSFKQEQSPRYSALRAASVLASYHNAPLVLGSATPTIVDRFLAEVHKSPVFLLKKSARKNTQPPTIAIVDMTKKPYFTRHRFLSNTLLDTLADTLRKNEQSLIFHNRRGSTPTTLCENCGWSAACNRCFVPLTLHADAFELRCHICNHTERVPTSCPQCHQTNIIHKGIGTKLIEAELKRLFPKASIMRFDGDSAQEETVNKKYQDLYDGKIDIIVGTQVIAKGLDLPHLRTVGIVQADSGLLLPDFQASERVFQLVSQVRGRIGRNEHASNLVVQSYHPQHPSITYGIRQDYEGFYNETLQERKRAIFPPFTHLLKLTCVYKTEAGAIRACQDLAKRLMAQKHPDVTLFGPTPSFYERIRDTYRWQLVLKSPKREHLIRLMANIPPSKWQSELDPISLL
jgi:primosomal protein N' (replication factor Y) (superfamily II helicase)